MIKFSRTQGNIALLMVTIVWGSGFVVTKICLNAGLSASFINIIRGAALMLLTFALSYKAIFKMTKRDVFVGIIAGATNAVAFLLQAVGLIYTTPTMSGFLTIMHIVLVPIIALLFYKKRPKPQMIPAVIIALIGTVVLTGVSFSNWKMGMGELLSLFGALSFAVSIAFIGNSGQGTDPTVIGFWMGTMHMLISVVYFFLDIPMVFSAINWGMVVLPLLYLSVIGTFLASNIQVLSQKVIDETTAAIIMSMEAVFSAVISLAFGYDKFSWSLVIGGVLIFGGVSIAIINFKSLIKFGKKPKD